MALEYQILLFIFLFIAAFSFFYYMQKNRVLRETLKRAYEKLDTSSSNRLRTQHRLADTTQRNFFDRLLYRMEQRYIYSGLDQKIPGITVEVWLLIILFTATIVYIVTFILTDSFIKSIIFMGIYVGLIFLLQSYLIARNYKVVNKELMNFLNMLSNFSLTNGELTMVLYKVARYLPQPMKTEFEDCYHRAYTTGNSRHALDELKLRIEHPLFKEILTNLISCMSYSANYKEVINTFRNLIREEQNNQTERKKINATNITTMIMTSCGLLASIYIADGMVERSIWLIFINTTGGNIALIFISLSYLYFIWKVWTIDR